tara:strand:- start:3857 stop:4033 length:177 start_codon:yes stop_codon:yes gene_type:complete
MGGAIIMVCEYCKKAAGIEVEFETVIVDAEHALEYDDYNEGDKISQCPHCMSIEGENG